MSSPLAKAKKSFIDSVLVFLHQKTAHFNRVSLLVSGFQYHIEKLNVKDCRLLDIGCGDMRLSRELSESINSSRYCGVDIYPEPDHSERKGWGGYVQFDGTSLPFAADEFDVAIFSDVLHHVSESNRAALLSEALRVCRYVVVKDHFEYGFFSRHTLRAMDFFGNYGYGVSVPRRYFEKSSFREFCIEAGASEVDVFTGFDLYSHIPLFGTILRKEWQFYAVCSRAG